MSTKEWKYDWWNHGINPITGHYHKKQTLNPRGPMPKPEIDDYTEDELSTQYKLIERKKWLY